MKKLLTLALLLCTTLLSAQTKDNTTWQEIDTLIAQGHYTSAYEKGEQLLKKAKRKGDSHAMLKAVYKQRTAAAFYQEDHIEASVRAYQDIIPTLRGVEKSVAYILFSSALDDYKDRYLWRNGNSRSSVTLPDLTIEALHEVAIDDLALWSQERFSDAKRLCYEAALVDGKALKATKVEDYDLLIKGDTLGLRLRPTLYDVVMHSLIDGMYIRNIQTELLNQRDLLLGTAEEFLSLSLPSDSLMYDMWQLSKLQELTHYHQHTRDAAVRAHIDCMRMEALESFRHNSSWEDVYFNGLERIAESYKNSATEQAMFLYKLAEYHQPNIYEYSNQETVAEELKKAEKMERYIERIRQIAPDSEWARLGEMLYKRVTHPYLTIQNQKVLLPGQENSITIMSRNAGNIAYRIVPRYAGEHSYNFDFKKVIGRKSVGKAYMEVKLDYPNPYVYQKIELSLPPLDAGDYFVIATNDGQTEETKRSSIIHISVSNLKISMMLNEAEEEYIGMVIDATTGKAVTNCEITMMERTNSKTLFVEEYTPDEKGHFIIPLPTGKYRNLYIQATDGESQATYSLRHSDFPEHRYWNQDEDASTLFTFLPDRYSYEPGDTVRFGLITYSHGEEGSRVKKHLPIGVSLRDTRNKEVASLQGRTDEWGRFNGSFIVPEDITTGRFRLQATDSLSERTMYHYINVEAFKAPTFTAEIERPKGTVRFGDSLTLQGIATTFTQMPVGDAKVKYELMITDMNIFGRYPLNDAYMSETSGMTSSDEKGVFNIPLKIESQNIPDENATYNYIITAHITDASGETQTAKTNFVVGHRTKHIKFAYPAIFRHGDSIRYSFRTLNGERIADNVTLRLSELKVPHSTEILTSVESGREQWDEAHTYILRTEQTAADRDSHIVLTKDLPYGFYRLTATYTDGDKQYSEDYYLELWGEGKGTVSSYALYQTRVETRQDMLTGDTAVLYVGTRHSDVYIHYYIQVENRLVDKGTICLNNEMTVLRVPIKEDWRNNMRISLVSVKENVRNISSESFSIKNKTDILNVHTSTIRNYLEPGEKEQCTVSISDYYGNPVQSAFALSIYDAALDTYGANRWDIALAPTKYGRRVTIDESATSSWSNNTYVSMPRAIQPKYYTLPEGGMGEDRIFYSAAPTAARGLVKSNAKFDMANAEYLVVEEVVAEDAEEEGATAQDAATSEVPSPHLRTALSHTALFLPTLRTDEQGQVTFTVTAPDLLTQWHVKGIAHTKDLKHGRVNFDFVTRKTLMVQPHVPRFLYEGDKCDFTAKVSNSGDEPLEAVVKLKIDNEEYSKTVSVAPNSSTSVSFPIIAPAGADHLTYRITAENLRYSDGEQARIAILPRRTLVTETMALYINGTEKREFVFDALKENHSETLEHKSLTLDIVANPIWYAIEALAPLCKEENPSNERLFHRYYAATMGSYLIDCYPEVEGYNDFYHRDSLSTLRNDLLNRLATSQSSDGGWAWMNGFDSDRYTTLLIIKGLGELEAMGCISIAQNDTLYTMVKRGIGFLDANYHDSYIRMKRKPTTLDSYALYYLYTRSMFPEMPFGDTPSIAYDHYKKLLLADKATKGTLMQKAMKMLTLIRLTEQSKAAAIAEVVRQSSLSSDEMGVYWRDNTYGWAWDSNPIATQALLIEAFAQLNQPTDIIGRMQQWLLKQKQTTQWNNSIATAQAVHALVGASPHPLPKRGLSNSAESMKIKVGGKPLTSAMSTVPLFIEGRAEQSEAEGVAFGPFGRRTTFPSEARSKNLGIIKRQWAPNEISPSLARVSIEKQPPGISWGSMTWQYYEDADKVKASGTGMTLKCTYYKVENREGKEILTALPAPSLFKGDEPEGRRGYSFESFTALHKGDRIRVRLQFTTDRAMDYVELHLQRPAALEPTSTRSGYTYSNGIGYYRSIENTQTKFYFYRLDKGEYFIDCDLWVSQSGSYTCGVSTIQCMYAPEFVATTESNTIRIEE